MEGQVVRVQLELQPDTDPIAGRAVDADGRVCSFSNWLSLIAVLEELRRRDAPDDRPRISSA